MHNARAVVYLPDRFAVGQAWFAISEPNGPRIVSPEEIADEEGALVTFETHTLVDEFLRRGLAPPKGLFDIEDALKLIAGTSRTDGGEKLSDVWRALQGRFSRQEGHRLLRDIFQARVQWPDESVLTALMIDGCFALESLWNDTVAALSAKNEKARFEAVEVPCQSIFLHRQFEGIGLNRTALADLIEAANNEKYNAYCAISKTLGVSASGLRFRNVGQYLYRTDARHLLDYAGAEDLESYFRLIDDTSTFARYFLAYSRASYDVSTLVRLNDSGDRVHCHFHTLGTVTGRALVSNPSLQQLRRSYRSVIIPDQGNCLVYLDYAQCEPGVVASLSGDKGLISAYNKGDVYKMLSTTLFGTDAFRKKSKKVFLAYTFGMRRSSMARILAGPDADAETIHDLEAKLEGFFDSFPRLEPYRRELEAKLEKDGFVSSLLGNRRYRKNDELTNAERRWCVSQAVQGTAALIFKEALLALADRFGSGCVLLPMHDAVLLQFRIDQVEQNVTLASQIMREAFRARCPEIEPRVTIEEFAASPL